MPDRKHGWTLRDVVDLEVELAAGRKASPAVVASIREAAAGLSGGEARRVGLLLWLEAVREGESGGKVSSALGLVAALLGVVAFVAGIGVVSGLLEQAKGGIHVTLYLAVIIGGQWLILLMAGMAWLIRRRAQGGFSLVQGLIARLAIRFSGMAGEAPWSRLMSEGGGVLLWRTARIAQGAGLWLNLGFICGLGGLVMIRHVGFFWETTTEVAMQGVLERVCGLLAAPWAAWWPEAVPDEGVIAASRWMPGRDGGSGPAEWWRFLLMSTLVWGLLPRLVLWVVAWRGEERALAKLDFQGRHHRSLWRELTGPERVDADEVPADGVLVLDVGGGGFSSELLRPFLLRCMRVNPTAWHSLAVLDEHEEKAAALALAKAPAGLVFLTEGWALSPARMKALHAKAREQAGPQLPIRFLVANSGANGAPAAPTAEERAAWEQFTDSLRDPEAEVVFYEEAVAAW